MSQFTSGKSNTSRSGCSIAHLACTRAVNATSTATPSSSSATVMDVIADAKGAGLWRNILDTACAVAQPADSNRRDTTSIRIALLLVLSQCSGTQPNLAVLRYQRSAWRWLPTPEKVLEDKSICSHYRALSNKLKFGAGGRAPISRARR